jgi:hypothetical protein
MDSRELTPAQAGKLYLQLRATFEYLAAVQKRMESQKWPTMIGSISTPKPHATRCSFYAATYKR